MRAPGCRERAFEAITRHTAYSASDLSKTPAATPALILVSNVIEAPEPAVAEIAEPEEISVPEPMPENENQPIAANDAPEPAPIACAISMEGAGIMWDRLTPDHFEDAKRELSRRRAETLARHAEELKALEAEQEEIDALDRAIEVFARKFAARSDAAAEVVNLKQERGLRA